MQTIIEVAAKKNAASLIEIQRVENGRLTYVQAVPSPKSSLPTHVKI
jgi:hypothetical protein